MLCHNHQTPPFRTQPLTRSCSYQVHVSQPANVLTQFTIYHFSGISLSWRELPRPTPCPCPESSLTSVTVLYWGMRAPLSWQRTVLNPHPCSWVPHRISHGLCRNCDLQEYPSLPFPLPGQLPSLHHSSAPGGPPQELTRTLLSLSVSVLGQTDFVHKDSCAGCSNHGVNVNAHYPRAMPNNIQL